MPQEAATATVAASLDSLLSPKAQTFDVNQTIRESVAESDFNDVALEDDSRFSTVALSSRRSSSSAGSSVHTLDSPRPHSNSSTLESSFEAPKKPSHKKSVSTTTIRSNHNLTFLLAKLEEDSTKRGSIDGQIKLQEGFARLQKEKGDQIETENSNDAEVIDWDFWGAVMSDYQQFASEEPERLAQAIAKGIPGTLRGMMWQLMAASKDPELESTYLKLLKETSPHEKAITRDLGRTFPHHDFFTDGDGIGQENLFNVLKAYSLYDTQVGYCQGLPFVVAILLLNMPDEEAFSLLVRLMYVYDLRGHFLPEMPKLQLRLFQFDRLVEELLPVLHIHFLRQGVKSSMFCSQWFLTMFSYRFPLDVVFRIYDNCLANGIEAMFGFSIALLRKNEDLLLGLKFDEILTFLNTKLFDRYKVQSAECGDLHGVKYNADEFVNEAVSLRITPFQLDTYGHEYDDIMREANKRKVEMDELRTTNRNLSAKVKSLEADFAQLSTEHVELLNELVKARLQNEETESELVRYKLLYAEAMHQNEEAPVRLPEVSAEVVPSTTGSSQAFCQMLLLRRQCITHSQRAFHPLRPVSRDIWTAPARLRRRTSESGRTTQGRSRERNSTWLVYPATILVLSGLGYVAYNNSKPFKHTVLAIIRCARVGEAAILGAIDYKWTFAGSYETEEERMQAYSECHTRSAKRVLKALLANGEGVFIKLGQHMSSLIMLPREWTSTMRPLQDQCQPTPYENLEGLFLSDMGASIDELFDDFDPNPIGVASLAQVHVGHHHASGKRVAVKLQHPHLAEFCDIDMAMVEVALGWIKYWFPEFEFTWLGEEMRENLPKEMDFVHEATNAKKTANDFKNIRTSLYIPEVIVAKKRVLIMEYIQGARVDDLEYLADANIDRNKVALELSRIFNQMIFINGWFHADPHLGNLLIRLAPQTSKSPYNFEVVLLDHGLYFDLDTPLRVNYGKFWLSLFAPASESANADRRKYAQLVGNVGPDLYPIFEAAITGRAGLEGTFESGTFERASDMMSISPQTEEEVQLIQNTIMTREGMFASILHVLRHVPRRVLMVLKVNDLLRNLDHSLMTTHSNVRMFLIMAKYCIHAVWQDDRLRVIDSIRDRGLFSFSLLFNYFRCWWRYQKSYAQVVLAESIMDIQAHSVITRAWIRGLLTKGFRGAHLAAAGLA